MLDHNHRALPPSAAVSKLSRKHTTPLAASQLLPASSAEPASSCVGSQNANRRTARRLCRAATIVTLATSFLGAPLASRTIAATPIFGPPVYDPFGLGYLAGGHATEIVDIDGDGDLDFFVGRYFPGDVFYYENTGSATAATFAPAVQNPFGLAIIPGGFPAPALSDIDGDGDLDAFICNEDGDTYFAENTGSASSPAFGAYSANPFGLVSVGFRGYPEFADIDGDGDRDAFITSLNDTYYFQNMGSPTAPAFAPPSLNPFGIVPISASQQSKLADVDQDGDLDLLRGTAFADTAFYENTGGSTSPAFATPSTNPFGLPGSFGHSLGVEFIDIDGDGDLDGFMTYLNHNNDYPVIFFENVALECGNAAVEAEVGEDCDDGNTGSGDCCDSACQYEPIGSPCDAGNVCTASDTCDGGGACQLGQAPSGCAESWANGSLLIKEGGRSKFLAKLIGGPILQQSDFGDPVAGSTAYDLCIFDDALALMGQNRIDRAGQTCGTSDCFRRVGTKGYIYKDTGSAYGLSLIKMLGATEAGKSKIIIKGRYGAPFGVTWALQGSSSAIVQLHSSDGTTPCVSTTFATVIENQPGTFIAKR